MKKRARCRHRTGTRERGCGREGIWGNCLKGFLPHLERAMVVGDKEGVIKEDFSEEVTPQKVSKNEKEVAR